MDSAMEQTQSPGKVLSAFCCVALWNGALAIPFAIFWLSNPDVNYTQTFKNPTTGAVISTNTTQYFCITPNDAQNDLTNFGINPTNFVTYSQNDIDQVLAFNATSFDNTTNVSNEFTAWFFWGFIMMMTFVGGSFISVVGALLKSEFLLKLSSLVTGITSCCGFLAWFIAGNVFRWRSYGQICSGTSQTLPVNGVFEPKSVAGLAIIAGNPDQTTVPGLLISSGNFINIWNIIIYSVCGCCCCLSIIGGIVSKSKSG